MRKFGMMAAATLFALATMPAQAKGVQLDTRLALYYGTYEFESNTVFANTEHANTYGLGTGLTFRAARFFADLGIEYFDVSDGNSANFDFVRTDTTLTFGVSATNWLAPYLGFRLANQDTSTLFDDDVWSEYGYFAGLGFGFPAGPLNLGISLAYNINYVDQPFATDDEDYNGISAKIRMGLGRTPHAIELRAQRFEGEDTGLNFSETYAYIGYVLSLGLL